MSLFLVIYILGKVGGTVGPLPYGADECKTRAAEMVAEARDNPASKIRLADVRIVCEFHAVRPANTFPETPKQ